VQVYSVSTIVAYASYNLYKHFDLECDISISIWLHDIDHHDHHHHHDNHNDNDNHNHHNDNVDDVMMIFMLM